jgi:hypothetical protein
VLEQTIRNVQLNKRRVVLLAALGATLGAFPFLLYVGFLRFLPFVTVVAVVVATLSVRKIQYSATEEPTWGEWLLGGWSTLFMASLISFGGFLFYGSFYWGSRLLVMGTAYLGFSLELDAQRIATIAGTIFVAFYVLLTAFIAKDLLQKLYPEVLGTRSPFFPFTAKPRNILLAALVLVLAIAIGLSLLEPTGLWFTLSLTLALFFTSGSLANAGERRGTQETSDVSRMVEKLLLAAGYNITPSPVTGNAAIDPLISDVDYLARSGDYAFAVELKVSSDSARSLDWSTASALRTAAKALQDVMPRGAAPIAVNPLLIIVGGRVDDSLEQFSAEQGVKLVHLSGRGALDDALGVAGPALRERALQLLGIPPGMGSNAPLMGSLS